MKGTRQQPTGRWAAPALIFIFSLAVLLLASCAGTREQQTRGPESEGAGVLELGALMPVDPAVRTGKLDNGLVYYVRANAKPEKRAELRLVVDAGSVVEDDDQQGVAHYLEHMAFNGTENFAKSEIVDYLESIGVRFGPDLNASTGYDRTLYRLQVPTDSEGALETGLQILEDWAHLITFAEEEVERERGIIIEEWRLRRGAGARIWDKQIPYLFQGSRYAERRPIGKLELIEKFGVDDMLRFYRDWYRPDLMAVIAVGNFDAGRMENLIREHFSRLEPAENARERIYYPMPDHEQTLFAIATDPEATESRLSVITKHEVEPFDRVGDYRRNLVESLYHMMLNDRLQELTRKPDPPFLNGYSGKSRFVRTKEFYMLGADIKEDAFSRGLEALLTEAKRVREFGFTETELERARKELLVSIENVYNERDKTDSSRYVREYVGNFLEGEPIPGIEYEYALYKKYVPEIGLEEVNDLAGKWLVEDNRVILASSPEKPGFKIPSEADLLTVFDSVAQKAVSAYQDQISDAPLVAAMPQPGRVVSEARIERLDLTEWRLSNGVRVFLKPTDFKNDEIVFNAFSPGGHSLVPDELYIAARTAVSVIEEAGLADFSLTELQKKLAGKTVSVSPFISEQYEGFRGSAAPRDLETLFQLIYLYFTAPRENEDAFATYQTRLKAQLENRASSPEQIFWDTVRSAISDDHIRSRPWTTEILSEMSLEQSLAIYRNRFADAGDFTFIFVGNLDPAAIRPLIETYLGGLPATGRDENWRDLGIDPPDGIDERTVRMGIEPKSRVQLSFNGTYTWSWEEMFVMDPLAQVLEMQLRDSLREKEGGTYDIGVWASPSRFPDEEYHVFVGFGCAPENVEKLTGLVFEEVRRLRDEGPKQTNVAKVKEMLRRQRETNLENNGFWANVLRSYTINGLDQKLILEYDRLVDDLSTDSIQAAANRYLNADRYVKVVLYPQGN